MKKYFSNNNVKTILATFKRKAYEGKVVNLGNSSEVSEGKSMLQEQLNTLEAKLQQLDEVEQQIGGARQGLMSEIELVKQQMDELERQSQSALNLSDRYENMNNINMEQQNALQQAMQNLNRY